MADRFGVAPQIPVLDTVPPGSPGFLRVYGRGDKVYAVDENGVETLLTNEAGGGGGGGIQFPFSLLSGLTQRTFLSTVEQRANSAFNLVKTTYQYSGNYGAATAASAAVTGNRNWTNPANAQALPNGTVATLTATATAAANANLTLTYTGLTGKTAFPITQVLLVFHASLTVGTLQTVSMVGRYSLNGGTNYTQLFSRNAAFNNIAAGESFDITSAIGGNWANLANVRVQIQGTLGTSIGTGTASVDAVRLVVATTPIEVMQ
jgi:hypothetical protein